MSSKNPDRKHRKSKSKSKEKPAWHWGINNNTKTHCHILEMIFDALKVDGMKQYRKFIRKNITELCLEVGNMSDFFEQLNYIITTDSSKDTKINNIMELRDESGKKFIHPEIAEVIYKAMTMSYVKQNMTDQQAGAGADVPAGAPAPEASPLTVKPIKFPEGQVKSMGNYITCYRQLTKDGKKITRKKCKSGDNCDELGDKCQTGDCSVVNPNHPGYYQNIAKMEEELYNKYGDNGAAAPIIEGRCLPKDQLGDLDLKKFKDTCDIKNLNELCDLGETDLDKVDGKTEELVKKANDDNKAMCRQMIGSFHKTIKGKDRVSKCKDVRKATQGQLKEEGTRLIKPDVPCYRKITKGTLGYNQAKCSGLDDNECKAKDSKCDRGNCSVEDPDYPGYYRNISDKELSEKLYKRDGEKTIEGKCLDKDELIKYDYYIFKDTKNIHKSNTFCNPEHLKTLCQKFKEDDPDIINDDVKKMVEEYEKEKKPWCRQMLGDFTRRLKQNKEPDLCGKVNRKKDDVIGESHPLYGTGIVPAREAVTCYRQISQGRIPGKYNIKRCKSGSADSCDDKALKCEIGDCAVRTEKNPALFIKASDNKKTLFKEKGPEVLEGKCLQKEELKYFYIRDYQSNKCDDPNILADFCEKYDDDPKSIIADIRMRADAFYGENKYKCGQQMGKFAEVLEGKDKKKKCREILIELGKMDPDEGTLKGKMKSGFKSAKGLAAMGLKGAKESSKKGMAKLSAMSDKMSQDMAAAQAQGQPMDPLAMPKMGDVQQSFQNFKQSPTVQGLEAGLNSLGQKLGSELINFNNQTKNVSKEALANFQRDNENFRNSNCLPFLPQLVIPSIFYEFNIPLNLNDVLLIGFSVFPYIGWIFDIFMIFRALLEKRWLYAILMVINWYHWFFWKILSFGTANVDLGPLLKVFYMGPYASRYFNITNVASTFIHFISELSGNMPTMLSIQN